MAQTPASEREHERILSSYGGAYDDPRLEALIGKTVDRLVAASDRPDLAYKVTILNSARSTPSRCRPASSMSRAAWSRLPTTPRNCPRCWPRDGACARKHASIREEQARQAALVTRVVTDMINDPELSALALAKSKLTLASFSRAQEFEADGIGVGIAARAVSILMGRAFPYLDGAQRRAQGRQDLARSARAGLPVVAPGNAERMQNAQANARQYTSPQGGERDRETYLADIDNIVYGEDPSEGFVRGRRFLHPKLGFTFPPPNFTLDNTAQAVIGVAMAAPRRCGSTWCGCRPSRRSPTI